ncbi:MAG TPA: aminotransferase class III-fold pyridoxal phosphate-dependent enzyme [Chitinophagales bacterium]|nr:aspartate aminotransferase family protein [Chitinophagales bacterium]MBP6155261.1 aspartate aminotransferase family protein [Chitinophagales bacterium]HQV78996.1 aminotransferase class III-fold pyridoxal phosphate-dependent enzyme [Chitinophagales bacterium]HQW79962.1 aminotransferase class III-fold pyridoxal phosphate-dependent enzyme [Chitinophagales bacterium]HRB19693.1 aminotransferase class III-fold pyridoxal phosphate-dependent enzyme [Chitinophagales bacterium]
MKLFDVYPLFDTHLEKGKGCYVYDTNGQKYLDFYGGHAVISIGHAHEHYIKRITDQLHKLSFYSNSVQLDIQQEFASKLGQLSGCDDYHLFLINSGAEAIENALKVASFHNGRKKIIAFKGAFHGRTSAAVAVTDNPKIKAPINDDSNVIFLALNDVHALTNAFNEHEICAVVVESIQGINGIYEANASFLQQIQALCHQHNALFIADEIQCGYGRSGKFFAFQYANVQPDVITMAKGMGNGFPIGGILIHPKYAAKYGMLGTTFGGSPLACAAGLAVLEVMENEKLMDNTTTVGNYLLEQCMSLSNIKEVRGKGLMIGLEFDFPIKDLRNQLLQEYHIFVGNSNNVHTLRLLPSLTIGKTEVDIFMATLKKCIK